MTNMKLYVLSLVISVGIGISTPESEQQCCGWGTTPGDYSGVYEVPPLELSNSNGLCIGPVGTMPSFVVADCSELQANNDDKYIITEDDDVTSHIVSMLSDILIDGEKVRGMDNGNLFTNSLNFGDDTEERFTTTYSGEKGPLHAPKPSGVAFLATTSILTKNDIKLSETPYFIGMPEQNLYSGSLCTKFPSNGDISSTAECQPRAVRKNRVKQSLLGAISGFEVNSNVRTKTDSLNVFNKSALTYRQIVMVRNAETSVFTYKSKDGRSSEIENIGTGLRVESTEVQELDITGGELIARLGNKNITMSFEDTFVSGTFKRDISKIPSNCLKHTDKCTHANPGEGEPEFEPKVQSNVKIIIRPAQCKDRRHWDLDYGFPCCETVDNQRLLDTGVFANCKEVCEIPEDDPAVASCPRWMQVTGGDNCCKGNGYFALKRPPASCEAGLCYFIDYEFPLVQDGIRSQRTLLGSVNNVADGLSEGVYFVYDPEIYANTDDAAACTVFLRILCFIVRIIQFLTFGLFRFPMCNVCN